LIDINRSDENVIGVSVINKIFFFISLHTSSYYIQLLT